MAKLSNLRKTKFSETSKSYALQRVDKLILRAGKRKKKWVRFCPVCKSTDVALRAHMEMIWYYCRKCSYHSPSFPEKTIIKKL